MIWALALVAALIPAMVLGTPVSETYKGNLAEDLEIAEFVNKSCTMHGAHDKVPQVMGSVEKFQTCLESLVNDLGSIIPKDGKRKEFDGELIKKYCALAPQIRNCTYFLLDFVDLCGHKDDKEDLERTRHFVDQLPAYVCHNDGERVISFLKNGGIPCIQKNFNELRKCTAFIADQLESDEDEDNSEENDVCEVFEYTSNCFLSSMDDCEEKPVKIIQDFSAHLRKVMNCTGAEEEGRKVYREWLHARTTLN